MTFDEQREVEYEITEALALLGRWSHVFERLAAHDKKAWEAVVAKAQGSADRTHVRRELDAFIKNVLRPVVERMS